MNSQELRALQEAYSQVYELDEAKVDKDKTMVQKIKSRNERSGIDSTPQRRLRTQAMRGIGKGGGFQSRSNPQRINDSYDLYDIILSHLLDEGYADTEQAAQVIMVNMSEDWREEIVEGLDMKTFKANRKKNERKAASADAKSRGHVSKNIVTHGKTYSSDEAKSRRANMSDTERATRKSVAMNPDQVGDTRETADKTKNQNKLRKQKAMGEH